jgi:hypothetical protein
MTSKSIIKTGIKMVGAKPTYKIGVLILKRLTKEEITKGQQIVEERVQLTLAKIAINKQLGYWKYDIQEELSILLELMEKYGVKSNKTVNMLLNTK